MRTRTALLALILSASPLAAQTDPEGDRAGRFDYGKMWTFENPPETYFTETYGFTADDAWFERARGAALRLPGCSAAFVSPRGLVVTNHHCIRGEIFELTRPGEDLMANGFYAPTLQDERPMPGYYIDQLIAVEDVSAEVLAAVDRATGDAAKRQARGQAMATARDRILAATSAPAGEGEIVVQVVPLYNGGRYSAYTFRRFTDVRLVAAAEEQLGFFGGDPDNFTYPRYALDFGFMRIYGANGQPIENDQYFGWSEEGVEAEDVVFVIGNPGATNRLSTIAQLEFRRDVLLPAQARVFDSRIRAMWDFYREDPAAADALGIRNDAFSLSNSWKQYVGQIEALGTPEILARKRDAERLLRDSIAARPELRTAYGHVIDSIAALQPLNRRLEPYYNGFLLWGNPIIESATIRRAILAERIVRASLAYATPSISADSVAALRRALVAIPDLPRGLERRFLLERLRDFATLPQDDPLRRATLGDDTPEALTDLLLDRSAMGSAERAARVLEGTLAADDRAVRMVMGARPLLEQYQALQQSTSAPEAELGALLGRARFEIYGTDVPPDGSSSPRITDGVVRGYSYNGTLAPPYTTFFGMYDRYHANPGSIEWSLAERWITPPAELDLNTPLNFVSTADTYGGNSGSPAVTRDLAIVGLNFDRNIEGMTRNFIYMPESGRNIMVDVRAIREALDDVYDADRIVLEVLTHRMYATEREADAVAR